ncbi:hypothetical protein H0H93_006592 [Arthromyces matolae]|nr:hypothetical protein H0H93_006592 [Arthromyces matolae]
MLEDEFDSYFENFTVEELDQLDELENDSSGTPSAISRSIGAATSVSALPEPSIAPHVIENSFSLNVEVPTEAQLVPKRGRGRPKGSRNQPRPMLDTAADKVIAKRPVGRPRGSGPHQKVAAESGRVGAVISGRIEKNKAPAKSKKDFSSRKSSNAIVGLFVPGTLPLRQANTRKSNTPDTVSGIISKDEGKQVLEAISMDWIDHIRSRVLKDPFHVFNMFYISASHGLLRDFAIALRDAIFLWDQADKDCIVAWGKAQSPPLSWDDIRRTRPTWLQQRCKRIIPPPEQLLPVVAKVFKTYGPLKDAKSGLPLFNSAAWTIAKNILLLIQKGHLSDPPGIALYYQLGIDSKTGLPIYRCMRGTNMTEGGVHTHLRSRLPTSGVSIRHSHLSLLDFIIRHNLLVGTFNSTGKRYVGHYSIWITNQLQEMLALVGDMLIDPRGPELSGWVNGNLYHPTNETAGVLPIPNDVRSKLSMAAYVPALHSKQPHHFLASKQGTRKPVLPISNTDERKLFHSFMTSNSAFNDCDAGPNWDVAALTWNNAADADATGLVSYKITEQLKAYYNEWKKYCNIKQTKSMAIHERTTISKLVQNPSRSLKAPQALEAPRTLHSVTKGLQEGQDPLPPQIEHGPSPSPPHVAWATPQPVSSSSNAPSPALNHMAPTPSSNLPGTMFQTAVRRAAQKRALDTLPNPPIKKRKQPRTCQKCGQGEGCRGRKEARLCSNRCRDCGNVECRGRNSKHPDKKCHEAWD